MNFSSVRKNIPERPAIQMAPLIDIVFLLLVFFMSASIFYQLETEINITVPTAETAAQTMRAPGEIIINVRRDGTIVVNQRKLSREDLKDMLGRISKLYKGQPVIIRADRETFHEDVVAVLDICAGSDIWNISFATMKEENR
jgi:biopolymer transport protein ExbD